ncbi:MAG: fibronectin type III domain-containing protein [Kofleriaceae bacterium]|nr:fibronectin type III domain-containing protein [Kofleriaceae bacterium]
MLGLAAGCLGAEDELLAEDDLGTEAAALVSPQVAGLSSSGVPDPMAAVDGDLATGTTVDSAVGNCPLYNSGPFIKLNAGHCLFTPTGTTFFGWAMVKLRVGNGGDVDLVELRLTHDRTGSTASPAPQTLVHTSWDGKAFSARGAFTASTTRTTSTIRLVPPTRPAPYVWVVLGKSTVSAAAPAGPTLRWFELAATHLAPPAGLTARAVSATAIDLSWADTSTAETGFEVFVQPAGGAWRSLGLDPGGANQTSERITGLAPSTTYAFQLRARSGTTSSRPSNTASATTPAGPPGRLALVNNSQVDVLQVPVRRRRPRAQPGRRQPGPVRPPGRHLPRGRGARLRRWRRHRRRRRGVRRELDRHRGVGPDGDPERGAAHRRPGAHPLRPGGRLRSGRLHRFERLPHGRAALPRQRRLRLLARRRPPAVGHDHQHHVQPAVADLHALHRRRPHDGLALRHPRRPRRHRAGPPPPRHAVVSRWLRGLGGAVARVTCPILPVRSMAARASDALGSTSCR